jgi:tetratricopeptide (TPR) repeat protein
MKILVFSLVVNLLGMQDSLVLFKDLEFSSDEEKHNFASIASDDLDYFSFFSSINTDFGSVEQKKYANQFYRLVDDLKSEKQSKKKEKAVKKVYNSVHDTFFDKYVLENDFTKIFSTGEYNCVSATGLYAIAFTRLGIPYVIKETPSHVYLVAYPESESILVETTNPVHGYLQFNDNFKRDYVQKLKNVKIIGTAEAASMPFEDLFNKYFFTDENIDIIELIGIQYYNDGIYELHNEHYKRAWVQFQKSYYLYGHERTAYMLMTAGSLVINKLEPSDPAYSQFVITLSRFADYGIDNDMITSEFGLITNSMLFERSMLDRYNRTYDEFKTGIRDDSLKRDISFIYHYEVGRYYSQAGQASKALDFVEIAYSIKPEHVQARTFLVAAIREKVARSGDSKTISRFLEDYSIKYPLLDTNPIFETMKLSSFLAASSDYYYERNEKAGKIFLEKFEAAYKPGNPDLAVERWLISKTYSSAALYYFRKGYKTKAKQLVNNGLQLVPGSSSLQQLLSMMK